MARPFDIAVLIGRFQPFHNAHAALLVQALESADRVIVILGSAHAARSAKNPFTWEERAAMMTTALNEVTQARVSFQPIRDYYDDRRWGDAVTAAVQKQTKRGARVALVGYLKDASSHYLQRFPGWAFVATPQFGEIDATALRQIYFESEDWAATQALLSGLAPASVVHYLKGWARLPCYTQLRGEHLSIEENKKIWGVGPFITVDAVVTASEHVLLVERGRSPGKGLWAVPGGFLEPRERVLQGAIRELREETGFALLPSSLEGALKAAVVFDHPDRSLRGRTITHAHWFDLGSCRLPEVMGADDAAQAKWVPIAELAGMESQFFEDHFNMLDHFLHLDTDR
ncbi:MAG: bifunctional nicotinamide-nucleotide adenylyltransferase/Nudix hydroxylase [Azonexus sp.]|uniref:bifunctional nicotinamide-nucleotide adenylyltransferase/Nudix hydroxylase n=1 Tax=Azonexus sp. TaxID=1872668 RepID=UPI0028331981|nr:bifunctional nicotinamide-nucleotide adenylyltransferase/Nudix hydroxylase [Azonexus sp.]MDR0777296.1 bifunctional nicotinamide-nucleotide adenylyltransferase/Nudix hydroxylase [Azonexus sp.]